MKKIFVIMMFIILFVTMVVVKVDIMDSRDVTLEMLQDRKGTIIIEKCIGIVEQDNGGRILNYDSNNYYIGYRGVNANEGDIVLTYFVYNPFNNIEDDIVWRIDFVL